LDVLNLKGDTHGWVHKRVGVDIQKIWVGCLFMATNK
jgi:hypothetical protein